MDEGIPMDLERVLEQASNWTFAGDFQLLQWMKQISMVFVYFYNPTFANVFYTLFYLDLRESFTIFIIIILKVNGT